MDMVAISSLYPEDTLVYGRCKSTFCAAISCPSDEDRRARKYMSQLLPFLVPTWHHGFMVMMVKSLTYMRAV